MTRFWPFAVRVFQSTPSARRATIAKIREQNTDSISIHALREEGDGAPLTSPRWTRNFNPRPPRGERRNRPVAQPDPGAISIHALREEGDDCKIPIHRKINSFQSTPSARRATNIVCAVGGGLLHFNPRPPWGKRPDKPKTPAPAKQFQSAISTWKATTDKLIVYDEAYMISIHALREESDLPV